MTRKLNSVNRPYNLYLAVVIDTDFVTWNSQYVQRSVHVQRVCSLLASGT